MPINKTQQGFVKTVVSCLLEKQADEKLTPVTTMECGGDSCALGFTSEVMESHDFLKQFSEYTKTATRSIKVFGIVEKAGHYSVSSALLSPTTSADDKSAAWRLSEQSEWHPADITKAQNNEFNFNVCIAYIINEMFTRNDVALHYLTYEMPVKNIVENWQYLSEMNNPVEFLNKKLVELQNTINKTPMPRVNPRFSPSKLSSSPSSSPSSFDTVTRGASSPVAAATKKTLKKEWTWVELEKFISTRVAILNGTADTKAKQAAKKELQTSIMPFIRDDQTVCKITGEVERTKILELLRVAAASLAYGLTAFPEEKESESAKRDRIENAAWMFYRRLRLAGVDKAKNMIGGTETADTKTAEKADTQTTDLRDVFVQKMPIDALVEFKSKHAMKDFGTTRQYFIAMVNYAIIDKYLNSSVPVSLNIIAAAIIENVSKETTAIKIGIIKLLAANSATDNAKPIFSNTAVARYLMAHCEQSQVAITDEKTNSDSITVDEKIKLYKAIADGSSAESLVARWRFIKLNLEQGVKFGKTQSNPVFENVLKYINEASGDPETGLTFDLNQIKEFWAYAGKKINGEKFLPILVKLSQQHEDYETQYWIYNDVAQVLFNGVSKDAAKQHVFFTYLRARGHGLCNMASSKFSVNKNVVKEIDATKAKLRDCLDSKDEKQSLAQRITNAAILLDLPKTDATVNPALAKETQETVDAIKANLELLVESCEIEHADKLWSFIQNDNDVQADLEFLDGPNKKNIIATLADCPKIIHAILAKLAVANLATTPQLKTTRNAILTALFTHAKLKPIALAWAKENSSIWNQYGHEKINGRILLLVALDAWKEKPQQGELLNEITLLKWVDLQKTNYPGLQFAELAKEIYTHPSISLDTLFNVCKVKVRASEADSTHIFAALDALTAREPKKLFELSGKVDGESKYSQFIRYCADKVHEQAVTNVDAKSAVGVQLQSKTKIFAAFISALFCLRSREAQPGYAARHIKYIDEVNGWTELESDYKESLEEGDIDKLVFFANSEDAAKAVWNIIAAKKSKLFEKANLVRLFGIIFKNAKVLVGTTSKVSLSFSKPGVTAAFNVLLAQPQEQIRKLFKASSSDNALTHSLGDILKDILKNPVNLLQPSVQQNKAERVAELFFSDEKTFASDKNNVKQFLLKMFEPTDSAEANKANGNALIKILVHLEKLKNQGLVDAACLQNIKTVIKEEAHLRVAFANCDAKEIVGSVARELLKELLKLRPWVQALPSGQELAFTKLLDENELKQQLEDCNTSIQTIQTTLGETQARLQIAPKAQAALYDKAANKPFAKEFSEWLKSLTPNDHKYDEDEIQTALNYAVIPNRKPLANDKLEIILRGLVKYKPGLTPHSERKEITALAKAIASLFKALRERNFVYDQTNIVEFICRDKNYTQFNAVVSLIWGEALAATNNTYNTLSIEHKTIQTDITRTEATLATLMGTRSRLVTTALSDPDSFTKVRDKTLNALRNFYSVAKQVRDSDDVVSYTDPERSDSVRSDSKRQDHAKQLVARLTEFEMAIGKEVLDGNLPLTTELHNKIRVYLLANKEAITTINAAVLAFQTRPVAADGSVDKTFVNAAADLSEVASDSKHDVTNELSKTAKELQIFVKTKDYAAIAKSIKALHANNKNSFKLIELYVAITATYNNAEQNLFLKVLNTYPEIAKHFYAWVGDNSRAQQNGWLAHFNKDIIKTVLTGDDKPALKIVKFISIITNKIAAEFDQKLFNECIDLCSSGNDANVLPVLNAIKNEIVKSPTALNHNVRQNDLLTYLLEYLKLHSAHIPNIITGDFFKQIAHLTAAKVLGSDPFKKQILKNAEADILTQTYCDGLIALYSTNDLKHIVQHQSDKQMSGRALLLAMLSSSKHGPILLKDFDTLNQLMHGLGVSFTDLMRIFETNNWSEDSKADTKHTPTEKAALYTDANLIPLFVMSKASTEVVFEDDVKVEKQTPATPKKQYSNRTLATPSDSPTRKNENLAINKMKCCIAGMSHSKIIEQAGLISSSYTVPVRADFLLTLFEYDEGLRALSLFMPLGELSDPKQNEYHFANFRARLVAELNEIVKTPGNIIKIWSAIDKGLPKQIDKMLAIFIENKIMTKAEISNQIIARNLKNVALQQLLRTVGNKDLTADEVNVEIAPLIKMLLNPVDNRVFENDSVKKWIFDNWSNLHNILNPAVGVREFPEFLIVLLKQKQFAEGLSADSLNLMLRRITAQQFIVALDNYANDKILVDKLLTAIPEFLKNWTVGQSGAQQTDGLLANENRALGDLVKRYLGSIEKTATTSDLFAALEHNPSFLNHPQIGDALKAVYQTPALLHAAVTHTKAVVAPGFDVRDTVVNLAKKDNFSKDQFHNALGRVFFSSLTIDQRIVVGKAFQPTAAKLASGEGALNAKKLKLLADYNECCANAKEKAASTAWWKYIPIIGVPGFYGLFRLLKAAGQWLGLVSSPKKPEVVFNDVHNAMINGETVEVIIDPPTNNARAASGLGCTKSPVPGQSDVCRDNVIPHHTLPILIGSGKAGNKTNPITGSVDFSIASKVNIPGGTSSVSGTSRARTVAVDSVPDGERAKRQLVNS